MAQRVVRKYPMVDAALIAFVRLMITRFTRDLADLALYGVTSGKITALDTQCDDFEDLSPDSEEEMDISELVAQRDAQRLVIHNIIMTIALRAENKWGRSSKKFQRVANQTDRLIHTNNSVFIQNCKTVLRIVEERLAELASEGQLQAEIDSTRLLLNEFSDTVGDVENEISDRREKTDARVRAGNALYDTTMNYLAYGFNHYSRLNSIKEEDYVLQNFLGHGAVNPPDMPANLRLVGNEFAFDPDPNATSHNVRTSTNGTTYDQTFNNLTSNSVAVNLPSSGSIKLEAQSQNNGGQSDWASLVIAIALAGPENFRYENDAFRYNAVYGAEFYEMRYRPASGGDYIQVFIQSTLIYTWTPPAGDWIFEIRAFNGEVTSPWIVLELTVS